MLTCQGLVGVVQSDHIVYAPIPCQLFIDNMVSFHRHQVVVGPMSVMGGQLVRQLLDERSCNEALAWKFDAWAGDYQRPR